ncbi:enoyl-CoA hydratase/isomerase family protein [Blastomonas sp.]|uniref:enoyl-CoA hydratase/isomerase family protein n=1 Tax=Blastomonas sp. TaxID=1909299 RepID=UPI00391D0F63
MNDLPVLVSFDAGVATLTLNRPETGNTINMDMAQALLQAAIRCDTDGAIRCVVLTGSGRLFCAGGDLSSFADAGTNVAAFLSQLAGTLHMAVSRLMRMRKPLVVLANGPAAGAGLSLALAGDIVLAAPNAHFTAAYGAVGLSPDGGMSWLLPRLVGMRKAQQMIISNRRVGADEAAEIGLVSHVVSAEELTSEGMKQASLLASGATGAIGAARALLLDSYGDSFEGHLDREARSISALGTTDESREGIAAFLEKRRPDFIGMQRAQTDKA